MAIEAAPAPFERPATAEAILSTQTPLRARAVRQRLLSPAFLDSVLSSARIQQLSCLEGVKDRRAWLSSRLKIEIIRDRAQLRIRLSGCPDKEGLVLLQEVTAGLTRVSVHDNRSRTRGRDELVQRRLILMLRQMEAARGGGVVAGREKAEMEEQLARFEIETNPPKVHKAPRRLRWER
jgi:hypothetical protein